jgi:hypothetical protein
VSCEKVINIDFPDEGRKIVLNSLFDSDSTLTIKLTKSVHVLSTNYNFEPVTNATVWLYENEQLIETTTENDEGYYHFNSKIKSGKTYSINANADGLPGISSKTIVPTPVIIDTINLDFRIVNEVFGPFLKQIDFNLEFKDNPLEQNFYMLNAYFYQIEGYAVSQDNDTTYMKNRCNLNLSTPIPAITENNGYIGMSIIFDDATFNGELYNLQFQSEYLYFNAYYNQDPETTIYFSLSSISKDYYLYLVSYSKYLDIQGIPLAEPIKVHSNIENGFGIFAGAAIAIDSVKFNMDDVLK